MTNIGKVDKYFLKLFFVFYLLLFED